MQTNPPTPMLANKPTVLQRSTSLAGLSQYINPNLFEKARMAAAAHESSMYYAMPGARPDTYKTVMCQTWLETANCGFGANCKFAHGEADLRITGHPMPINRKYKTRLCEKYTVKGICPYGARCLFIHPEPTMPLPSMSQFVNPCVDGAHFSHLQQLQLQMPAFNVFNAFKTPMHHSPKTTRRPSRNLLPQVLSELRLEKVKEEPGKWSSRRTSQSESLLPNVLSELRLEKREERKRQIFQMLEKQQRRPDEKPNAVTNNDEEPSPQDTSIDAQQTDTLASTLASVLDYSAGSGGMGC